MLLEYDDARSGSFEPLRHVPEDKTVVLGLVGTKLPRTEGPSFYERRLRDAARFVPADRLAISSQCGFSTSVVGNRISPEDQRDKLRIIAETARNFWSEG